jgi:uncharacterized membrane protein
MFPIVRGKKKPPKEHIMQTFTLSKKLINKHFILGFVGLGLGLGLVIIAFVLWG